MIANRKELYSCQNQLPYVTFPYPVLKVSCMKQIVEWTFNVKQISMHKCYFHAWKWYFMQENKYYENLHFHA